VKVESLSHISFLSVPPSLSLGGGVYLYSSNFDALLRNVTFRNVAFYGSAPPPPPPPSLPFSFHASTSLLLVLITVSASGGALNADSDNTNLRLIACHFLNNSAHFGELSALLSCLILSTGAAFTLYSSHEVTLLHDCSFRHNKALSEAGAVYVVSINEDIEVYNCEFFDNEAGSNRGAFAFVNGNTNVTFRDSIFLSNELESNLLSLLQ
jgi:hypothetical protein